MATRDQRQQQSKIDTGKLLRVVVSSIGSDIKYELETHTVSRQGIFLTFKDPRRFPFTSSSILEVTLYLSDTETIFFNGKVSQIVYKEDAAPGGAEAGIGLRVVQISSKDQAMFDSYLAGSSRQVEVQDAS